MRADGLARCGGTQVLWRPPTGVTPGQDQVSPCPNVWHVQYYWSDHMFNLFHLSLYCPWISIYIQTIPNPCLPRTPSGWTPASNCSHGESFYIALHSPNCSTLLSYHSLWHWNLCDLMILWRWELDQLLQASTSTGSPPQSPRDPSPPWPPRQVLLTQPRAVLLPRANLAAELLSHSQAQHRTSSQGNDKDCQIRSEPCKTIKSLRISNIGAAPAPRGESSPPDKYGTSVVIMKYSAASTFKFTFKFYLISTCQYSTMSISSQSNPWPSEGSANPRGRRLQWVESRLERGESEPGGEDHPHNCPSRWTQRLWYVLRTLDLPFSYSWCSCRFPNQTG